MDTKQNILKYLLTEGDIDPFSPKITKNSTIEISERLNISRTLASQYLNELHKHEKIVKIISRPVLYLSVEKIARELNTHIRKYEFEDIDEYKEWFLRVNENDGIVGSNGSLLYAIKQIQTGLLYTDNGLPILLSGYEGSGQKYLIRNLLSMNKRKSLLERSWKLVSVYVSDYKDAKGLCIELNKVLKNTEHILLYLYNISSLSPNDSVKAISYLMKLKDKKTPFNFIVELNEADLPAYSKIIEGIPILANIPALKERPIYERHAIILHVLENETAIHCKRVMIESLVFDILEHLTLEINISTLQRMIKQMIASAYHESLQQSEMIVRIHNLPNDASHEYLEDHIYNKQKTGYLDLQEALQLTGDYTLSAFCTAFLHKFEEECIEEIGDVRSFCEGQFYGIRSYINDQIDSYYYKEMKKTIIMQITKDILSLFEDSLNIYLPTGFAYFISQFSDITYLQDEYQKLMCLNEKESIQVLLNYLETNCANAFTYANRFMKQLNQKGNVSINPLILIMTTICIEFFNQGNQQKKIGAVIISHGVSTATSIADTANFLLGNKIFTAMDMPMSMNSKDMAVKLNEYLNFNNLYDYVIILVDMGSLTEIMNDIDQKHNFTYGIINNVSTALALEIGSRIKQGQNFFEIIKNTVENIQNEYSIIQLAQKKKAIVITSDLGKKTASKIAALFKNSLPEQHPFTIIEYDFTSLQEKKTELLIFKEYEVVLLIRPEALDIEGYTCLSLEDVIYMRNLDKLNIVLNQYFTKEQTAVFHMNLIKNFSLENVVENLTILNAKNLMDLVVDSVEKLIQSLKKSIDARTRIGIYIHICFLIERLVTKNEIHVDKDITEAFLEKNKRFIQITEQSFHNMLESYSVQLPVSEIKYLYDYIYIKEEQHG